VFVAFIYCTNLTAIEVDPANSAYCSAEGILYTKDKSALIQCPAGKTGTITIPNSVTSIGDYAFNGSGLTGVIIGNKVESIGNEAFGACHSLTSVAIPDSVTTIADSAFWMCTNLASVTLGNKVTSIGRYAFYRVALTEITIPASVASIGSQTFYECANLATVIFEGNIPASGFPEVDESDPFPFNRSAFDGDLQAKYLRTTAPVGGIGTYTTTAPVGDSSVWTKE
jgi:hypothetical protein